MQDRWTLDRLTVSGGVRLDFLNTSTEPFTLGPHRWLPNRNVHFDAVENVPNWKDVNPRVSAAYDLFGNGKTAIKGSASRGVQQESIAIARANNPANTVATTTQSRVDRQRQRLLSRLRPDQSAPPTANAVAQPELRTSAAPFRGPRYDRSIMEGWGVRPYNWEFSAGVQQELLPRVSLSFGYFRRINGNFQITDNEALSRTDFTRVLGDRADDDHARWQLPNAGGTVTGLFDPNINIPARNVVKDASVYGKQLSHWDGVDLNVDARLRNGLFLQGGVSTGKTMTDNCDIVDDAPEILGARSRRSFCHFETPFLPQYKALASYTLPWYGIRVAGTWQSLVPLQVAANNIYNNANRLTSTTLPRPFTLAQRT